MVLIFKKVKELHMCMCFQGYGYLISIYTQIQTDLCAINISADN